MAVLEGSSSGTAAEGESKGLKDGALGLMSSTVIAISSTAPAYSLAAALALVVAAVGFQAPAIMLVAFIPMVLIAQGYARLNKEMPDCGTTFTWGAKAFGPRTGFMGGWAIVAADVIVMSNLAQIAGQYFFELFGLHSLSQNTTWVTVAGVIWIAVMCWICYIGIEVSARIQYGLLIIEVIMLLVLSVTALAKVYSGHAPGAATADLHNAAAGAHHVAWSWFNPFGVSSTTALTSGLLAAIFIYWGWDTAVSVNEETKDKDKTPGRAALLATVILLLTYLLVSTAADSFAGLGSHGIGLLNTNNSGDVLSVLGGKVFGTTGLGWFLAKLLVLMVLTSSMASTLTTILPTARTTLSMAVYRSIPSKFSRIHPQYLTPTWSTVGMGLASAILYVGVTVISANLMLDMIDCVGFSIAFYYGMTGFACAWWYRRRLTSSLRNFLMAGVLPFLGGCMLLYIFVKSAITYWKPVNSYTVLKLGSVHVGGTFVLGVGSLILGVVLMVIYERIAPDFFKGRVLTKETPVLVPERDPADLKATLEAEGLLAGDGTPTNDPERGDMQ
jgi:amino acid transporter